MKVIELSCVLLLALIVFTGCQADEDDVPTPQMEEEEPLEFDPALANEFTYQGTTQALTDAILIGDGERNTDGRISWQLYLTTDGLIEDDGTFSGTGDFLLLELNTGNPDGLVSSTYVLNGIAQQLTYNSTSSLYSDFNLSELTGSVTNIRNGEVTLTVQGDQIIAEFDFDLA
ncbi:MAG: hypothetical protein AAFO02_20365, partial [Bacteroidota bacterium]